MNGLYVKLMMTLHFTSRTAYQLFLLESNGRIQTPVIYLNFLISENWKIDSVQKY